MVVIEVICFCRRNAILDSFLFLDKILWIWGFSPPPLCKYLVTLQVVVTLAVFDKLLLFTAVKLSTCPKI